MNEFLNEKAKEQKKALSDYKHEDFKENIEAKKEDFVQKKANMLDDLQRSVIFPFISF